MLQLPRSWRLRTRRLRWQQQPLLLLQSLYRMPAPQRSGRCKTLHDTMSVFTQL